MHRPDSNGVTTAPLAQTKAQAGPRTSDRTTRRLLAAAVVAAPTLIALNALLHPEVELSGASILAGASLDPSRWFAVHTVAAVGAMLGVPAAFGLRRLIAQRGRRLAHAGLTLVVLSSPILALTFAAEASVLRLAAAELDPTAALRLADAYARSPEFYAVGAAVAMTTLGGVLLGAALLVGREVPRWLAVPYLVATLATVAAAPGTLVGPVAFGLVAVVSIFLAARVVRPVATRRSPE